MANHKMDILDVVRKRLGEDETDFLQDALSAFLRALMEAEVNTQAGAAYGERSGERVSQRNGYRDRRWDTRAGTLELATVVDADENLESPGSVLLDVEAQLLGVSVHAEGLGRDCLSRAIQSRVVSRWSS